MIKYIIAISTAIGLTFASYYDVGDIVSDSHQNVTKSTCWAGNDYDAGVAPFTCADFLPGGSMAGIGCGGMWGATAVADACPATCGTCPEEDVCGVCDGDGSSCTDCAGTPDGDAEEDCFGTCNGDAIIDCAGSCLPGSIMSWQGDGYCDDGAFGVDFVSCGD